METLDTIPFFTLTILWKRKLRPREGIGVAQDHATSLDQRWDQNPGLQMQNLCPSNAASLLHPRRCKRTCQRLCRQKQALPHSRGDKETQWLLLIEQPFSLFSVTFSARLCCNIVHNSKPRHLTQANKQNNNNNEKHSYTSSSDQGE